MRGREFRNDVMWLAFASIPADTVGEVMRTNITRALRRFKPSPFGGWRVTNKRRGKRVNRNR